MSAQTFWDEVVTGLHVRERANGKRAYFFYYRTRTGKQRRPKIGDCDRINVTEARNRARQIAHMVAVGQDPKGEWDKGRKEKDVAFVFEDCLKNHWGKARYVNSTWAKQAERLYRKEIAPVFGDKKLSEIRAAEIREWHEKCFAGRETLGNRALSVLSSLFDHAIKMEWMPQNSNTCKLVDKHKERKRKRFATEGEIKKVFEILRREQKDHPRQVAFMYLLIFSGSRPSAIEKATWDMLDEKKGYGVLTFRGKTTEDSGEEEQVILPPVAMDAIKKLEVKDHFIVGIKMPRLFWEKVREEAGCDDMWARDWRRTFATVGLSSGVNVGVIGELLNHKSAQTTKVYAKLMDTEKNEAVTKIADRIVSMAFDTPTKEEAPDFNKAILSGLDKALEKETLKIVNKRTNKRTNKETDIWD